MNKKYLPVILLAAAAVLSFFLLARVSSLVMKGIGVEDYLGQKQITVMEITAASTAASTAVTLLPGDVGTPIAEKLADMSTYSMLVLCAILIEKYLVSVTGSLAFKLLVPIACILLIINRLIIQKKSFREFCLKIICIGILAYAVVPVSVLTSKTIEESYQASITETIDEAMESAQEIEENSSDETILQKFVNTFGGGVNQIVHKFEGILNQMIEALSVMIVTSCVIPLIVLMFMWWMIKTLLQGAGINAETMQITRKA